MPPVEPPRAAARLDLPPILTPHLAAPGQPAFSQACACARAGTLSASDVMLSPRDEDASSGLVGIELAIVLEPDVQRLACRQLAPLMMVAAAEALGVLLPPKVAVEHVWPGTILLNGAAGGVVRLAQSEAMADGVPDWLVVGARFNLARTRAADEPGLHLSRTTLADEGGESLAAEDVLAAIARHFLAWLDRWQEEGFTPVAREWLFRAHARTAGQGVPDHDAPVQVTGLAEDCALVWRTGDGTPGTSTWPADVAPGAEA
ncbi:MAG: biotin/lipoate--protein ligase family protein [Hyphomicrobiaceae bacterium]